MIDRQNQQETPKEAQKTLKQDLKDKGEFQHIFFMHLLFEQEPKRPPLETVQKALREKWGDVDVVSPSGLWSFAVKKYPVDFADAKQLPAQVMLTEAMPSSTGDLGPMERSQLWNVQDGPELLDRCPWKIMVSDFMSDLLDYPQRCEMLLGWLEAALELFPECVAVWFPSAGKLHTAQQVREILKEGGEDAFIRLAVNARFFNIQGTEDRVVDTLGLYAIGLPDVQYHFHGLDPNFVVNHAYCLASYLFANRAPIQSGETVDGCTPDGEIRRDIQWKCQYENALIQPQREVLDVCAGAYAAGQRE